MAADVVEEEGIRRARSEMQRADRVLYVMDAALGNAEPAPDGAHIPDLAHMPEGVPVVLVMNKIDLLGMAPRVESNTTFTRIFLSAQTGAGIELLRDHLKTSAGYRDAGSGALSARRRHLEALRRARELLESAADTMRRVRGIELIAEDLRLAQRSLGEITGEFTSDDLLGEIFGSFCIGK
jgi:tRNA modification GTPase